MKTKTKRLLGDLTGILYPMSAPILALIAGEMTSLACVVTCVWIAIGGLHNLFKPSPKGRSDPPSPV